MVRILVTGMSGTGKTTLLAELARRGRRVVDTDYGGYVLPEGTWDEPRIAALLAAHEEIVVQGTVENQGRFRDRFDHIVLLSAPLEVILNRVAARRNNPYGSTPADRAEIRSQHAEVEPLLRRSADLELDALRPTAELADVLEQLLGSGPRTSR
ncbi:AAA family ATPase [Brachybacterium phenoliresistens]|uniref:AAA family ATPase n=1 Tax=Brachybacterium phenoliresistens TaxID=396014 RepID=UPI0031DD7D59